MTMEIAAFEAKADLYRLLREVQEGERYTITLRGQPVADLVPSGHAVAEERRTAVDAMRKIRRIVGAADMDLETWIREGRM